MMAPGKTAMFINEYGSRDNPVIILLAPMMVSGSDLYNLMKPYLKGSYHVIAPDQGGHGKAGAYRSADEEYKVLKDFLLQTGCTDIALASGGPYCDCGYKRKAASPAEKDRF